ncbi:MAG: helix-turn-helix transcriptional regulator [Bdellovibrionales bacterium]|nr:helix-turn-helix transcriptional regulator [Bdellovibrionales bacterium]
MGTRRRPHSGSTADFGAYLKAARLRAGLTQADVARHLGLRSGQSISDWERNYGSSVPSPALVKLIALYRLRAGEVLENLYAYESAILRRELELRLAPLASQGRRARPRRA